MSAVKVKAGTAQIFLVRRGFIEHAMDRSAVNVALWIICSIMAAEAGFRLPGRGRGKTVAQVTGAAVAAAGVGIDAARAAVGPGGGVGKIFAVNGDRAAVAAAALLKVILFI